MNTDQRFKALNALLKAEKGYLLSCNWQIVVRNHHTMWKAPNPLGDVMFQGSAIRFQREVDLGRCA